MPTTVVVSEKGQVTLPKSMRDRLGIRPGSRLELQISDDGTLRVRVLARGADALFGLLARKGEPSKSIEQMDAAVTEVVKTRARRSR